MRKAIQKRFTLYNAGNLSAVVFLIQKEAGFLSVLHVHGITDPVFDDFGLRGFGMVVFGNPCPSLILRKSLQFADGNVVSFVNGIYLFAAFA